MALKVMPASKYPRPFGPDTMWGFHSHPKNIGSADAWILDLLAQDMRALHMNYALLLFGDEDGLRTIIQWANREGFCVIPRRMVRGWEEYTNAAQDARVALEAGGWGIQVFNELEIESTEGGRREDVEANVRKLVRTCRTVYNVVVGGKRALPAVQMISPRYVRRFAEIVKAEDPELAEGIVYLAHSYGSGKPPEYDADEAGPLGFLVCADVFQEVWGARPPVYVTEWGWEPGSHDGIVTGPQEMAAKTLAVLRGLAAGEFPNGRQIEPWFRCLCQWLWMPQYENGTGMGGAAGWRIRLPSPNEPPYRPQHGLVWEGVKALPAWEREEQAQPEPVPEPEPPDTGGDHMKLSDYPRPTNDTRLGIHGGANASHPLGEHDNDIPKVLDELEAMGFRWVKLLADERTAIPEVKAMIARGMMPVVRLYRPRPKPGSIMQSGDHFEKTRAAIADYVALGVRYFETSNEDNLLGAEWQQDKLPKDIHEAVQISVDDFIRDADFIHGKGGLPGFPSMTPTDGGPGAFNDIWFYELAFARIKALKRQDIFEKGAWLSVHNAGLNHPVEYPDDPINQAEHPGQTIHTHRYADGVKPTGASNCWRKYEAVGKLFYDAFGFHVPVLSTEGGFWVDNGDDPRYPRLTSELQRDYTLEACRKMATAPDWYFCTGFWLYFNRFGGNQTDQWERDAWVGKYGTLPIVPAMKAVTWPVRSAPANEEPSPAPLPPTPEPPPQPEIKMVEMLPGLMAEDWRAKLQAAFPWNGKYSLRPWPNDPLLIGLCFHWDGTADGDEADPMKCAAAHHANGWAGIGYRYQVTQKGVIRWLGAPEEISAHAGNADLNRQYIGVLAEPTADDSMTEAQVVACRKLWQAIERGLGKSLAIVGHSEIRATECPGPKWAENKVRITTISPPPVEPPVNDLVERIALMKNDIGQAMQHLSDALGR